MKQITIIIPDGKLETTLKHIAKLNFAHITGESDIELTLDKKEREMLSLMLKGIGLKQISTRFKLNYHTARLKRNNLLDIVNPKHPDELVKYIIHHNLLGIKLRGNSKDRFTRLQDKQKDFLLDLLKGINHKNTARRLGILSGDADQYKKDLLEKVQKGNPEGIIRYIIKQNLLVKTTDPKADKNNKAGLSDREKEVLMLLLKGLSNAEIARRLKLSKRTVEVHRSSILIKTKTKKSIDLMGYALKNKLIRL